MTATSFTSLVLKKIIDESPWREDSSKAILLIADADPHEIGYTYRDYVTGNQIDWRIEAKKAADMKIKIDTVSICGRPWYKEPVGNDQRHLRTLQEQRQDRRDD